MASPPGGREDSFTGVSFAAEGTLRPVLWNRRRALSRLDTPKYDATLAKLPNVKELVMPEPSTPMLPTCPDCGGILHPTRIERLTSVEVASADADEDAVLVCQCLICGYTERRAVDPAGRGTSAPA
jgi:hypothetical protein